MTVGEQKIVIAQQGNASDDDHQLEKTHQMKKKGTS